MTTPEHLNTSPAGAEELPPHIAALIASANRAEMETATVRATVWRRLVDHLGPEATRLAVGTGVVVVSKAGLALLLGAVAIGGALVGGTVVALRPVAAPAVSASVPTPPPTPEVVGSASAVSIPVATTAQPASTAKPAAVLRPSPRATPAASPTESADERLLIERARAALGRGDLDGASTALDLHAGAYPTGALSEDRDALRVLRHYLAGSAAASSEDAAFRARYPTSVYRPVLDRAAQRAGSAKDLPTAPQFSP